MFKFVALFAFVAFAAASGPDAAVEVKELINHVTADGFNYVLGTSDDVHESATGDVHGNIKGSYEFTSPEGEHIKVNYVADENGYQPDSAILPTPPPVPAAIVKALEYIRTHPSKEEGKH